VVAEFGGRAKFVAENYGDSEFAEKFGVKRYPAIFVNDVLVATPKDFGFTAQGEGDEPGRYAPLRSAASHARFRRDLSKVISLILAGNQSEANAMAAPVDSGEVAVLPAFSLTDLSGASVGPADLNGRVVFVEFWATWCPPCRSTLAWLGEVQKRFGDKVVVLALAVESDEADVRRLATELNVPVRWGMRSPDVLRAFGDVSTVPTLLIYGPDGRLAGAHYGATSTLHDEAELTITRALRGR
jgi:cytochrome c biogenesis protein CcmG, thiol:disulfide interchange protein DsbE